MNSRANNYSSKVSSSVNSPAQGNKEETKTPLKPKYNLRKGAKRSLPSSFKASYPLNEGDSDLDMENSSYELRPKKKKSYDEDSDFE